MRPTKATLALVGERDSWCCARCGGRVSGIRGRDWSLHHRRPAGMGGDKSPATHAPGNLILLHGSGTSGCHGITESERIGSQVLGLLVHKNSRIPPSMVPIQHALHGLCFLQDDGTVEYVSVVQ